MQPVSHVLTTQELADTVAMLERECDIIITPTLQIATAQIHPAMSVDIAKPAPTSIQREKHIRKIYTNSARIQTTKTLQNYKKYGKCR